MRYFTFRQLTLERPKLVAYPNPSDDRFVISVEDGFRGQFNIEVLNVMGLKINSYQFKKEKQQQDFEIDAHNLPSGMFLVQVNSKEQRIIKLIKR